MDQKNRLFPQNKKKLSWGTGLLCIVVELQQGRSAILILIFINLFSPNGALWANTNHTISSGYIAPATCFSLDNQEAITYNTFDS